ncbi:hypothetical protein F5B20DRAFT_524031 [Whalleya microplaca]|nr:hypothetical protein F5B20DRAFT_524031 [Whalleya microplaca]
MNSSDKHVSLQDSPDNHGAVVNIVSWFLLICSSLLVITRIGTKWGVSKSVHMDDSMIVGSLIFSISQTIATSIGVANGLGQHLENLSNDNLVAFQKSYYAANVLFIASQALSKLSAIFFIRVISPITLHRALSWVLTVATLVWALTSIPILLFQCNTPKIWSLLTNDCINQGSMWNYINVVNILLDVCLIWFSITVVWKLQTRLKRKVVVSSCFATRILTIAAIIWQVQESQKLPNHEDATFRYWSLSLSMSLAQSLGIIAACAPYLKPFLDSLESGLIRSDDIRRRANATGKSISASGYSQSRERGSLFTSQSRSTHAASHELSNLGHASSTQTASVTVDTVNVKGDWETGSHSSEAKLIKQVRTWGVTRSSALEVNSKK